MELTKALQEMETKPGDIQTIRNHTTGENGVSPGLWPPSLEALSLCPPNLGPSPEEVLGSPPKP